MCYPRTRTRYASGGSKSRSFASRRERCTSRSTPPSTGWMSDAPSRTWGERFALPMITFGGTPQISPGDSMPCRHSRPGFASTPKVRGLRSASGFQRSERRWWRCASGPRTRLRSRSKASPARSPFALALSCSSGPSLPRRSTCATGRRHAWPAGPRRCVRGRWGCGWRICGAQSGTWGGYRRRSSPCVRPAGSGASRGPSARRKLARLR